jgi:hypothetical protein
MEPEVAAVRVRWNGHLSETGVDVITRSEDFEGYRCYLSTSGTAGSFSQIGSYDVEDYVVFAWLSALGDWVRVSDRLTLEEIVCHYAAAGCGDSSWHPMDYSRARPYIMPGMPDSVLYFEPILANASIFGLETPFVKRFPAAAKPPYQLPGEVPPDSAEFYLTDDGYFKHYEYEYLIEDLLPGMTYHIAITALDHGSLALGAPPMETSPEATAQTVVPLYDNDCCTGTVGNVNCDPGHTVTIGDVSALIDHLFVTMGPLCCLGEADVNLSGGSQPTEDDITISDLALLIDHLFITFPELDDCP